MSRPARTLCEELEPRVLYSADTPEPLLLTDSGQQPAPAWRVEALQEAVSQPTAVSVREVAFVDAGLPDLDQLLADLGAQSGGARQIEIILLDPTKDGVQTISDALAERHSLDAIHLLTHGRAAAIQLGNTVLNLQAMDENAAHFAGWAQALNPDADIFLYGCDVAATVEGKALVAGLSKLTGADVAASSDVTGASGDWVLEYRYGALDATLSLGANGGMGWTGNLWNEIQVNTFTANAQATNASGSGGKQSIAVDADGDFVVVWTSDNQDGSGDGVYARRFNARGVALTAEVLVSQTTADDQRGPRVASDAAGNFVVTWTSHATDGTGDNVYFRRFNGSGAALTGEIRANTETTGSQRDAAIAMDSGTGQFVLTWEGKGPVDLDGVLYRRFAADGTALDMTEQQANAADSGTERDPAVTMTTGGAFVIAWETSNQIYLQRFLSTGALDGTAVLVSAASTNDSAVALAADAGGSYTAVFVTTGGASGVYARGYNADGSDRYVQFQVAGGDATDPDIAMASDGRFIVSYAASGDGDGKGVFARSYLANGVASAAAIQVNQYVAGAQEATSVALIDADRYAVAWSGQSASDTSGVRARSFLSSNAVPVAGADTYSVVQGQTLTVGAGAGLIANDTDADGDSISVLTATTPTNGTLSLAADGSFSYVPNVGFSGADSFSYLLQDSGNGRVHYWGLGGSAADALGGAHGTISGATTVSGQYGSALQFDGVNDHVTLTDLSYSAEFSVSLWFKLPSNAGFGYQTLYSHGASGAANSVNVYFLESAFPAVPNDLLRTRIVDGNDTDDVNGLDIDVGTYSLDDGNWHLYTLTTQTGVGSRVYIDGVLRATNANGGDALNPSGNAVVGGSHDLDVFRFYEGAIDGVQMHGRTLSASEIIAIRDVTPATVTFNVVPNTAPSINSDGGAANASLTVAENTTAVTTVTALDSQSPPQTLTYSVSGADAARFTIGSASGVLAFATAPNHEAPDDAGSDGTYDIVVTVSDGIDTDTQTLAITIGNVNEGPTIVVPGGQSTDTSMPLLFSVAGGNGVSVSDVDAGMATIEVDLAVNHGTLALASTVGLSFSVGTGSGDGHVVFTGTVTQVNTALDGLRYQPDGSFTGTATLVIDVDDLGNTGSGGGQSASQSLAITVTGTAPTPADPAEPVVPILNGDGDEEGSDPGSPGSGSIVSPLSEASGTAVAGPSASAPFADPSGIARAVVLAADQTEVSGLTLLAPAAPVSRAGALVAIAGSGLNPTAPESAAGAQSLVFQLLGASGRAPGAGLSVDEIRGSLSSSQFLAQLQFVRDQMEQAIRLEGAMIGATAFVSGGLSVGYVLWLLRGGLLMSTLLSSLPAWHTIDPLPVLGHKRGDADLSTDGDAVEHLFQDARDAQERKHPVAPPVPALSPGHAGDRVSPEASSRPLDEVDK